MPSITNDWKVKLYIATYLKKDKTKYILEMGCQQGIVMVMAFTSTNSLVAYLKTNSWWRHQMEAFSAFMALCECNPLVTGGSPYKGQWRGDLMCSLIWASRNGWATNRDASDLRSHCDHSDVNVMHRNSFKDVAHLSTDWWTSNELHALEHMIWYQDSTSRNDCRPTCATVGET